METQMKRYEELFNDEGISHRNDTANRTPECRSSSIQIPRSLLSLRDTSNVARSYSDLGPSHNNFNSQRNRRKRTKSFCSQVNVHVEPVTTSLRSVRKRPRRSFDSYDLEPSPLYNSKDCINRSVVIKNFSGKHHVSFTPLPLPREQQTLMHASRETSAASLNSASASSLSTHQETWNSCSSTYNRAKNTTERFLVDAVREQFQCMLKETRLCPNVDGIRTLRPQDVVPAHPSALGVGTFSRVTRVVLKGDRGQNKKSYACKQLKQELLSNVGDFIKAAAELAYEAFVLSCFYHPNIIRLRGLPEDGIASFGDAVNETQEIHVYPATSFFLIMDVLQETLDQRIQRWKTISRPQSLFEMRKRTIEKLSLCKQLADVLEYIHSKGVVYRDLKPQNIGFCEQEGGVLKLFDFGLSRELPMSIGEAASSTDSNPNEHVRFELSGMVGTIRYMAPEVCLSQPYNRDCDIYSWSIVSWEIWSEIKPFETFTPDSYKSLVCRQGYRPTDDYNSNLIPCEIECLLKEAWKTEPHQRIRWSGIKHQLDALQNSEELRLQVSILEVAISSTNAAAAPMNFPIFPSPVQRLHGALDVAVHSPRKKNKVTNNITLGEYEPKPFGSIQHHNAPIAQISLPQSRWSLGSSLAMSVDTLEPRIFLPGGIGSTCSMKGWQGCDGKIHHFLPICLHPRALFAR